MGQKTQYCKDAILTQLSKIEAMDCRSKDKQNFVKLGEV